MHFKKEFFEKIRILPIIEIKNDEDAVPAAKAIYGGGLPVIGICINTGAGFDAIRKITREVPGVYAGAAGVRTVEQAQAAVAAGAEFLCESRLDNKTTEWCEEHHIVVLENGSYKTVEIPDSLMRAKDFHAVKSAAKAAVREEMGFELLHVGVNCVDGDEARDVAEGFASLMSVDTNENPNSIFVGSAIEVMKYPFLGRCGHIAFSAKNVEKAVEYLKCMGIEPDMETAVYDDAGTLIVVYLKGEVGGFAIHLRQK